MDKTYYRDPATGSILLVAMILGFIFFWPVGLAILLFMTCFGPRYGRGARWNACGGNWNWQNNAWWSDNWYGDNSMNEEEQTGRSRNRRRHRHSRRGCSSRSRRSRHNYYSSGNTAFDTYREDTLQRLEEEQGEFEVFLDKLRQAKDKTEFDEFMTERKNRPDETPDAPEGEQPGA